MPFQFQALPAEPFADLFDLPEDTLAAKGMRRVKAQASTGYPCRVSLKDADAGEDLILLNHDHLNGNTPYAARHAIYVSEHGAQATPETGEVPQIVATRQLSMRGFDSDLLMQVGEVVDGDQIADRLAKVFEDPAIDFVDLHSAMRGCFLARAVRP